LVELVETPETEASRRVGVSTGSTTGDPEMIGT
jgi:hypothetical protein